jgi:hypothetical protein
LLFLYSCIFIFIFVSIENWELLVCITFVHIHQVSKILEHILLHERNNIFYWYQQVRRKCWYPPISTPIARGFGGGGVYLTVIRQFEHIWTVDSQIFIQTGEVLMPLDRRNGHRNLIDEWTYFQNKTRTRTGVLLSHMEKVEVLSRNNKYHSYFKYI